ncbi:MAG: cytochrome c [Alphaproteobacteria bacterium]|nr:cytochrome c [Alphaproteobacteria bacterium]
MPDQRLRVAAACLVVALLPMVANMAHAAEARGAEAAKIAAGAELAKRHCTSCHVIGPAQTHGTDQAPTWREIAARPTTTPEFLRGFLSHPHGGMPPLTLANEQIDDLAAYILSLRQ